jgi:hypothetical protein
MKPQSQEQPAVRPESQPQAQSPVQPQRLRPVAPDGAEAPGPGFADAPVDARSMTARGAAPAGPAQSAARSIVTEAYPRAHERRRSPRQTLVAKAVVRSEFNQNTVATGFLSNISMLGVGFHTRRPLSIGEKFQMRLELGPMRWSTRLRVVSCQPHESGTYDVGAEFIGSDLLDRVQRELAA